jgi:RES domain
VTLALPTSHIAKNTALMRVVLQARGAGGALHFGPRDGALPAGRFDSAAGTFRVCYLAESFRGAFAESLLRRATLPDPVTDVRAVAARDIGARAWAQTANNRALALADLRGGAGLSALGVTGAITMGDAHVTARAISDKIHALDARFDGIHFRARFDPDECVVALFDRAAGALAPVTEVTPLMADLGQLGGLLDHYRLAIDE